MAVIGINHNHIYGQIDLLLNAGVKLASFFAEEDELAAGFMKVHPEAQRVFHPDAIYEDRYVDLVLSAAIPSSRADIAVAAMRRGKDVMLDKPAVVTLEELQRLKAVQAETGQIVSVYYSERLNNRATQKASELVRAGAIGEVLHITSSGPHRLQRETRPPWFFDRSASGGILGDIASHQCEQFLYFADAMTADILSATVSNKAHPAVPGLQDFGDIHLSSGNTTGYLQVDWMTPEGLPVWGDGRLFITGSEGTIELRKNLDIAGRPGADHLFLADRRETRYIDCSNVELTYGPSLVSDILNRTETAMSQARCFNAMELALTAQLHAERDGHD